MSEREKEYGNILESLAKIRSGIVTDNQQELMFTGMMPPKAQAELKVVADITGSVFNGLGTLGVPIIPDPENPTMVYVNVNSIKYSCLKSQVAERAVNISVSAENKAVEEPPVSRNIPETEVKVPEPETRNEEQDIPETVFKEPENESPVSLDVNEVGPDPEITESRETKEVTEESKTTVEETPSETETETETEEETPVEGKMEVPVSEPAPVSSGARIIGGTPLAVATGGISKDEFFIDEQSKDINEFIYCYSRLSVCHTEMGGGGRPEEMLVLVAPLKVSRYAETTVPIVVTIVHNGKHVTASSYDTLEEGKNIVTIDIDEFYFLCRGSFDDKGKFRANIVTTGISSQQGDKITPLFSKSYGNGQMKEARNGHIKFHYTADSGAGSIEIFPFGPQDDRSEDFVAIVKNREFVDYYLVSKSLKASSKALVFSEGGVTNELVCHWEGDKLIADMI